MGRAAPRGSLALAAGDSRMKAEERKHLETNSLIETVTTLVEKGKHGLSRNAWMVIGVVSLAVVLFFVWRGFSSWSQTRDAERWVSWDRMAEAEGLDKASQTLVEEAKA